MVETRVSNILTSEKFAAFPHVRFGFSSCGLVTPSLPFGFNLSYNVGDREENVKRNREIFFGSLGIPSERVAFAEQCHSTVAVVAQEPGDYRECDALVTDRKNLFLTITVADCVPIFVFDKENQVVSAIHAGWRGTAGRIVEKTINKLVSEFGSREEDLLVYVGPSARSCCYEVGIDVVKQFSDEFLVRKDGRLFLNLKEANVTQLSAAGIQKENVQVNPYCTICNPVMFHSFRRDKERSGRMMGVLGLV